MNKFFLFLLLSFLVAAKPAYAGDIRIPAKGGGLYQVVIVDKGTEGAKYDGKTESIINTSSGPVYGGIHAPRRLRGRLL